MVAPGQTVPGRPVYYSAWSPARFFIFAAVAMFILAAFAFGGDTLDHIPGSTWFAAAWAAVLAAAAGRLALRAAINARTILFRLTRVMAHPRRSANTAKNLCRPSITRIWSVLPARL